MLWNLFGGGSTANPNQNTLAVTSEFSQLGRAIQKGKDTLTIVEQIPGVAKTTIDAYRTTLEEIKTYYNGPAATDTLESINSKRGIFERKTAQFVEQSQTDVKTKVDVDAKVEEMQKKPLDVKDEITKTAVSAVYWISFSIFVLWAGSSGSNLAFNLYEQKGSYTLFYFIYTAGLAAAYSLAVSWGIPYLISPEVSQTVRLIILLSFQMLCAAVFFSTTLSKELVYRAWILPLIADSSKGLFSYGAPVNPRPLPLTLPVLVAPSHVNHTVDTLLKAASTNSVTGSFTAPSVVSQAADLMTPRPI